ncbi:MAG: OmpP1/FadL family transporter [Verrucomicrobiales bacterium]
MGLAPGIVSGAGYYLPNQDTYATGRGNAFVATADSAAAVHYNPAGLTQLERAEAEFGVYAIVLGTETNAGGEANEAESELQAVPQIYYGAPYNDRVSYGFGLNAPFGLGSDWGRDTPFSAVVTEARLAYLSATAAVAYEVTDEWSVGAALSLNYADLTLEQGLGFAGSYFRFEGQGLGVSASLSTRWQPHEKHAFGLVYVTKSKFELDGKTSSNVFAGDSSSEMDFMAPARAAVGYSYRPAPGWNFEVNVEWLDWDDLDTPVLETSSIPGTDRVGVPFEWESMFIYEIGGSYTTESGYVFSVGYDFNMNAQPDTNYMPTVADADRHWLNLGMGRESEGCSWMLAYQFGFSDRTVDGAEGVNALANGDYDSRHHAVMFSWSREF